MDYSTEQILKALEEVKKEKGNNAKRTKKEYSECYTIEDWLDYFDDASVTELKAELSSLKNYQTGAKKNRKKALLTLLNG